jgi:hypothetical protein
MPAGGSSSRTEMEPELVTPDTRSLLLGQPEARNLNEWWAT